MASKVNTKFVAILAVAVLAAAGIIGFLYVLSVRGDAGRVFKIGEDAFVAGDFKKARDYFGRAVYKDPGNPLYLEKLEAATRQIVPDTADEAMLLYSRDLMGIYRHAARHRTSDPQAHLRLLQELLTAARCTGSNNWWQSLPLEAEYMWQNVPAENAERGKARVYSALAKFRLLQTHSADELQAVMRDLEAEMPSLQNDDLAWCAMITGHAALIERMQMDSRTQANIDAQTALLEETRLKAIQAVPNGPETARMNLFCLINMRFQGNPAVTADMVNAEAQRFVELLKKSDEPGLVFEGGPLLNVIPDIGPGLSIAVTEDFVARHPESIDLQLELSRLLYFNNRIDESQAIATAVLDRPTMPASRVTQIQFGLRKFAAGLLVDIEGRRYEEAEATAKAGQMRRMEEARDRLAALCLDPSTDPLLIKADGKIAFVKGDFNKAASSFERLIRESSGSTDIEVLYLSAACLERVGQVGLAHERISRAVESNPNVAPWVMTKARLEHQMGRTDDAMATLAKAPQGVRDLETTIKFEEFLQSKAASASASGLKQDSTEAAIAQAQAALGRGEIDAARSALVALLQSKPDVLEALVIMTHLEMNAGESEKARAYFDRAVAIAPENPVIKGLELLLKNEDPIVAMHEVVKINSPDEKARALNGMVNFSTMKFQRLAYAERVDKSNPTEASKARELSARAGVEAVKYAEQAALLEPDHPAVMDFQFSRAVEAKDWTKLDAVAKRAKELNLDQADGLLFRGRAELVQGKYQEAVRSLEAATDRISYSSAAWRSLGFAYQRMGNSGQALRAYEEAYKCNPNDIQSVREYLGVLLQRGEKARALRILQTAHLLVPDDVLLRDGWLQLESEIGDRSMALTTRRNWYKSDPNARQNALRLAQFLGQTAPTRELILDEKGQSTINESRWTRMTVDERQEALAKAKDEWYRESNSILDELSSKTTEPAILLQLASIRASLLRGRGEVAAGEEVINAFIASQPPEQVTSWMLIELSRYQVESNHFTEATATLEEALPKQDPARREVDQELGNLYQRLGQWEKAVTHFQSLSEVSNDRAIQNQITECIIKLGKLDDAEIRLRDAAAAFDEDATSTLLWASIAEARGDALLADSKTAEAEAKFIEQRNALAKAESLDPGNPTPRLLLAQSLIKEYRRTQRTTLLDDALDQLERADKIRTGIAETSMMRVAVLRMKNDRTAAISELRRFLEQSPNNSLARRDLVALFVESKQLARALEVIDEGIRLNPTIGAWHEARGDLLKSQPGDNRQAVADAYGAAYRFSPNNITILKAADALLTLPTPECKTVAEMLDSKPEYMKESPAHLEMHAAAVFCLNRRDEALEELRRAYKMRVDLISQGKGKAADISPWFFVLNEVFKSNEVAEAEKFVMELCGGKPNVFELRALAAMWQAASGKDNSHAIELQRKAIALCPASEKAMLVDLKMMLANCLLIAGHHQEASIVYEEVIALDPEHVSAMNNLAYLLAENMNQPDRAVPIAKRAAELSPTNGAILDTYGRVLYLNNQNDEAISVLTESVGYEKFAASYLHLAEALAKKGDLGAASRALDDAAKYNPDPETRQKIDQLADDIDKRRASGG